MKWGSWRGQQESPGIARHTKCPKYTQGEVEQTRDKSRNPRHAKRAHSAYRNAATSDREVALEKSAGVETPDRASPAHAWFRGSRTAARGTGAAVYLRQHELRRSLAAAHAPRWSCAIRTSPTAGSFVGRFTRPPRSQALSSLTRNTKHTSR